ncbi:MAG: peptidylprolyl isomerase [Rhodobacterales bacterium]|nr:peptidylprolyl isomerase [Rhodobacterales bacterium]
MNGAHGYHLFRASVQMFGRNPGALDTTEWAAAQAMADKTHVLETRVLAADEARAVAVSPGTVVAARDALAARFDNSGAFHGALAAAGLDEGALLTALERQLRADAVLESVAAGTPDPAEADIAAFYQANLARFRTPERRQARHILITINADFPENRPGAARRRMAAIQARLLAVPADQAVAAFAREAAAHSECPTALQGGALGAVRPGQLAPGLDAAVFALSPGQISDVVETEFGLHLARCDSLLAEAVVPLDAARPRIAKALKAALREQHLRLWLLRNGPHRDGPPRPLPHGKQERDRPCPP